METLNSLLNKYPVAIPHSSWEIQLSNFTHELLSMEGIDFLNLKPSKIPKNAGVYLITDNRNEKNEIVYYIGTSKNLRRRIYTNHLMGTLKSARLKKYLINDTANGDITDALIAKQFIRNNCKVRWILEEDYKQRAFIEAYLTAIIKPQFGIYEEH